MKKIKFIIKPSKEEVMILHKMQWATINVANKPNLKVEQAGRSFMPYLRMIITDIKVPHLTLTFKAKVVVVPNIAYHFTTPALVGMGIIYKSRDQCKKQYGNWYLQNVNYHPHEYEHINMSMPVTSHLDQQNRSNWWLHNLVKL